MNQVKATAGRPSRALLLVGSAKPKGESASEALLTYLGAQLEARGVAVEIEYVARFARRGEALVAAVEAADLFVLASPLYVDALPFLVTQACERIAEARGGGGGGRRPIAFAALLNCGFPEAEQCATALRIAELFARDAGFTWRGGTALGGGQPIGGQRLEDAPSAGAAVEALTLAAEALAAGEAIPARAVALMAKPTMPRFLYMMLGNIGWRVQALRSGALTKLGAEPFAADADADGEAS